MELGEGDEWDLVPHHRMDPEAARASRANHARLRNGHWRIHRAHGLKARLVHSTAYAVPLEVGPVDVSTFCAVLLHLRDPFLALQRATRLTRHTVVVTDLGARRDALPRLAGTTMFTVVAERVSPFAPPTP